MSLNSTPRTWVTGEVVTAAEMNAEIRDALTGVQAAFGTYTPTLTNITLGNGTLAGRFTRYGKFIIFTVTLTWGSTSVWAANPKMTLPVTALGVPFASTDCIAFDVSVGVGGYYAIAAVMDTTTTFLVKGYPAVAGSNLVTPSATVPHTWATGDVLSISGVYEAA